MELDASVPQQCKAAYNDGYSIMMKLIMTSFVVSMLIMFLLARKFKGERWAASQTVAQSRVLYYWHQNFGDFWALLTCSSIHRDKTCMWFPNTWLAQIERFTKHCTTWGQHIFIYTEEHFLHWGTFLLENSSYRRNSFQIFSSIVDLYLGNSEFQCLIFAFWEVTSSKTILVILRKF